MCQCSVGCKRNGFKEGTGRCTPLLDYATKGLAARDLDCSFPPKRTNFLQSAGSVSGKSLGTVSDCIFSVPPISLDSINFVPQDFETHRSSSRPGGD